VFESEHPSRSSVKSPNRMGARGGGKEAFVGGPPASSSDMSPPKAYVGNCYSIVTPPLPDYQTLVSGIWKSARTASRTFSGQLEEEEEL